MTHRENSILDTNPCDSNQHKQKDYVVCVENLKKNPEIAYQQGSADSEDDTQTNILLLGLGGVAVLIIPVGTIVIKIREL